MWRNFSVTPPSLVISFCGWTKGVGVDLLGKSIAAAEATHVVKLSSDKMHNFPSAAFWQKLEPKDSGLTTTAPNTHSVSETLTINFSERAREGCTVNTENDFCDLSKTLAPLKARGSKLTTCASARWNESNCGTLQWLLWGLSCAVVAHSDFNCFTPLPRYPQVASISQTLYAMQTCVRKNTICELVSNSFAQVPPWCFLFSDVLIYGGRGHPLEITGALAGCFVGLARRSPGNSRELENCLGLGMIRSINFLGRELYINAPLSCSQLATVDCLIIGEVNLPHTFKNSGGLFSSAPYMCSNSLAPEGTGARAIRSRNNLMRAGQG
mmetsp:Transcript_3620/g.8586  ORF Transcript_3620/g.8586 Transcript_3620/m.8586 type:complete len:325 (+) Transcript_3620:1511-2485(+)